MADRTTKAAPGSTSTAGRWTGSSTGHKVRKGCGVNVDNPACSNSATPDVMGYHTAAEIPNYWTYAKDFALNEKMFEPVKSWSLPDHLYLVSGWSAKCSSPAPSSCVNQIKGPYTPAQMQRYVDQAIDTGTADITNAWTDITWLLYNKHVSWAYYVQTGDQPDCENDSAVACPPVAQSYRTPGIWNPLPVFEDVQKDHQVRNIEPLQDYFGAAKAGTLPAVMWIAPSQADSEHPPASVHQGQAYVTAIINAAMKSPDWDSTAIFLQWDDWGGFYDNAVPPAVDQNGYGLRVPGLVSPRTPSRATSTPNALERRLPQVHRRRLLGRVEAQPEDRQAARSPPRRARRRQDPGQHGSGLRFRPGPAPAGSPPDQPTHGFALRTVLFPGPGALCRMHVHTAQHVEGMNDLSDTGAAPRICPTLFQKCLKSSPDPRSGIRRRWSATPAPHHPLSPPAICGAAPGSGDSGVLVRLGPGVSPGWSPGPASADNTDLRPPEPRQ